MFKTPLIARTHKRGEWKLESSLVYETNSGFLISVNSGFITDLASIPRPLRILFIVNGDHREAAVLHDWLYANKGKITNDRTGKKTTLNRLNADKLFLEAMSKTGVSFFRRWAMYLGVRLGGVFYWGLGEDESTKI